MQLVAHSPLVRQTCLLFADRSRDAAPCSTRSWRRRASHMFIDLDDRCAGAILCVNNASSCHLFVVSSRFHFSFLVFVSKFLILVAALATAQGGLVIKFQEAQKQNSARPSEIPNSSKQFPRPTWNRPHRIHPTPYDSTGKTQASSGRIQSLVK